MCTALPKTLYRPSRLISDLQPRRRLTVHDTCVSDLSPGLPLKRSTLPSDRLLFKFCLANLESVDVLDIYWLYIVCGLSLCFETAIVSLHGMRCTEPGRFCLFALTGIQMFQMDVTLNTIVLLCILLYIYLQICQLYCTYGIRRYVILLLLQYLCSHFVKSKK